MLYRAPGGSPDVLLAIPDGAERRAIDPPDVSKLPGASVVASIALSRPRDGASSGSLDTRLEAACVRAPSDRFVTGIESVLYERATALALRTEGLVPTELTAVQTKSDPEAGLYIQRLEGHSADRSIAIAHLLTFVGQDSDALLCTALCSSDRTLSNQDCASFASSMHLTGAHAPPPRPGILAHTIFWIADHPKPGGAIFLAISLAVVVWILRRRPRVI